MHALWRHANLRTPRADTDAMLWHGGPFSPRNQFHGRGEVEGHVRAYERTLPLPEAEGVNLQHGPFLRSACLSVCLSAAAEHEEVSELASERGSFPTTKE